MQGHRGLPSKLPANRARAKIFSPGTSPTKNSLSPVTAHRRQPKLETPQKSSSVSKSRHLLRSSEKPKNITQKLSIASSRVDAGGPRVTNFQLPQPLDTTAQAQAGQNGQFLQNMLNLVNKIGSNRLPQLQLHPEDPPSTRKSKLVVLNKKLMNSSNEPPQSTYQVKHIQYSSEPITPHTPALTDEQLLHTASLNLSSQGQWLSYRGELVNGVKEGYGIVLFRNGDKFMGGFQNDQANLHGTYYSPAAGRRVLGLWRDNALTDDYFVQSL